KLRSFSRVFFDFNLDDSFKLTNIGKGLIFDIEKKSTDIVEPSVYFNISKFDIVMTNPPYKGFRAEIKHYEDKMIYEEDKTYYEQLKNKIKKSFKYQGKSSPNIYKLFVEDITTNYMSPSGYAYLLIPQSILNDQSSTELRKYFLEEKDILHIYNIDEQMKIVDSKQALSAILLKNTKGLSNFPIVNHYGTSREVKVDIEGDQIKKNMNSSIIALSKEKMKIFDKMNSCKKIGEFSYINNLRGELDLTINKSSIKKNGIYKLIRGRNLSVFKLKNVDQNDEFISEEFVQNSKKNTFVFQERIACPQISNMNARKRLYFSYVPSNVVLGNSCNFIYVQPNDEGIDLYFLLGLLNSDLYDWYFRLYSSNNHINNYEIDNFPIPKVSIKEKQELSQIVKDGLYGEANNLLAKINSKVNSYFDKDNKKLKPMFDDKCIEDIKLAFPTIKSQKIMDYITNQISVEEFTDNTELNSFDLKVINSIKEKYDLIGRNEVLNHSSFKLSDLDMEMVQSVSPGGNWKEIPVEVAQKSKRLMRIRETGGRTTLYGRLDYSKPSYTITTYFNRPGNGTNIHPNLDRVLSVREAARIQGFPDDYYFYGNKKNKLNQIGNAVPPLIAYQIAKSIKKHIDVKNSLDLFSGAGGMTNGFKQADYYSVLMNDIDEAALITAKVNYPQSTAFLGDLTIKANRNYIINFAINNNVDIINGGPPCQGFSMAGFRNSNDPRSKLIYDYVAVLKEVKPKVFVFENVQGLLSHNKGKTFKNLLQLFLEVGYVVEARLMDFSDYGVPQKRKRVIIIGVRNDLEILPLKLFPKPITTPKEDKISVFDAIGDLEEVPLDEKSFYTNKVISNYTKVLKGQLNPDDYLSNLDNDCD
ncbi:DNA (cytosine-5-)-methyltransferase, partial [Enterococcus faecalis]|nr:DNA (cytosine-5-)-methyltransferase [Enterococcus faecalis]